MEKYNSQTECESYCIIEVIISIIIGVIVGILFANGVIPLIATFIIIALISSVGGLAILLSVLKIVSSEKDSCKKTRNCIKEEGICLLISSIGTLIAGTIALVFGIQAIAIVTILSVAFTTVFFSLMILSICSIISCLIREICK